MNAKTSLGHVLVSLTALGHAQQDFSKVEIKTIVLNTHFHGDHTGGNAHFGRDAHIIAHTNVRKRLGGVEGETKTGLPIITFADSLSVHFNGDE
jgi:glyoxylase-like metal-dependent hydrolase (beta-lactamase superfamily II)